MPIDRVRIVRVSSMPTRKPGCTQHVIDAENAAGFLQQYETVNDFRASLCARAIEVGRRVDVLWKDSRFGREIVSVTFEEQERAS